MTYVERLPSSTKNLINVAASGFPDLPQKAKIFVDSNIPCTTWFFLLRGRRENLGGNGWTNAAFGAEHMHRCSEPNQQRGNRREANLYIYMYIHTIHTPIFKLQLYLLFWRLVKALWRL